MYGRRLTAQQKDEMAKLKCCQDDAMLSSTYPIHGSASKVNRSGGDAQVVSCHHYFVTFHPFVEQLTVFHTSELIQAFVFYPPSP